MFGWFIAACKFLDAAMPYVGELSGKPHPSETAKIMGLKMMSIAETWFIVGLICLAILIATASACAGEQDKRFPAQADGMTALRLL